MAVIMIIAIESTPVPSTPLPAFNLIGAFNLRTPVPMWPAAFIVPVAVDGIYPLLWLMFISISKHSRTLVSIRAVGVDRRSEPLVAGSFSVESIFSTNVTTIVTPAVTGMAGMGKVQCFQVLIARVALSSDSVHTSRTFGSNTPVSAPQIVVVPSSVNIVVNSVPCGQITYVLPAAIVFIHFPAVRAARESYINGPQ